MEQNEIKELIKKNGGVYYPYCKDCPYFYGAEVNYCMYGETENCNDTRKCAAIDV